MNLYYLVFLSMYDRNVQNMLLSYTELKKSCQNWFLRGQLFRIGILLEKTLGNCYAGARKLDGYKKTEVVAKDFEDASNQQALESLLKLKI